MSKRKKEKQLLSKIAIALLTLFLLFIPAGCVRVEEPIQNTILKNNVLLRETEEILKTLSNRTGAEAAGLAIYDTEFNYRVVVVTHGTIPEINLDAINTKLPGYIEILETVRTGTTFYSEVKDLPDGILKNDLVRAKMESITASPIYDSKGYMIGYVAIALPNTSKIGESQTINYAEQAASKISVLL